MTMESIAMENLKKMMHTRGYGIREEDDNKIIAEDWKGNLIYALICEEPKLNYSAVDELFKKTLRQLNIKHCILVYRDVITPSAKKIIDNDTDFFFEPFCIDELQLDVTEHALVPLHERVPDSEAAEIRKKYGSNLKIMLHTDRIARHYLFRKGNIIRITQKNGYIDYRIVR